MPTDLSIWTERADRLGTIASAACFLHCLATPVVLSLCAVYAHFVPSEEHTHRVLAVLVTILGVFALSFGYRRHRRMSIFGLASSGLTLIFSGAFFGDLLPGHAWEVAITLAGSCCMISAHRLNHTFCKRCKSCT
jgi:hypothetical protein